MKSLQVAGQGNNMYIFPALGLAAVLARATAVTQSMVYASATARAASLSREEQAAGWLYPEVARIRDVSGFVAAGVLRAAQKAGVAREPALKELDDAGLERWVRARMYDPHREAERVERELGKRRNGVVNGVSKAASNL